MASSTRVKICGLTRPEDASMATAAGADYLGLILSPGFSRSLDLPSADAVVAEAGTRLVGVMVDPDPLWAIGAAARLGLDVVQLHGEEDPDVAAQIRAGGHWSVWKVIPFAGLGDLGRLDAFADAVDGVHVDSKRSDGRGGGGTGRTFEWAGVAEEVRRRMPGYLFVAAGGLNAQNVCRAVQALAPDVVDTSSGVESAPGRKDAALVTAFIRSVRQCSEDSGGTG